MLSVTNNGSVNISNKQGGLQVSAGSYKAESNALFAAMTTQPSSDRKKHINDFIAGCIADGNWSLLDGLWFLASHDSQSAKLNWKSPGTFTLIEVNSPSFTTDRGFDFDGTTQYIRTGIVPSAAVNFTLNSNVFGAYSREDFTHTGSIMGAGDGSIFSHMAPRATANTITARNNSASFASGIHTTSFGLFSCRRTSSSTYENWQNTTLINTVSVASVSRPVVEFYLGAINVSGTANFFCSRQLAFAYVGGGAIDVQKLSARVTTYLTAIGANV
jgi:hypothetical protein